MTFGFLVTSPSVSTKTKANKWYSVFRDAVYDGKKEIPTGFVPANVSYKVAVLFCSAAALRSFYLFVECVLLAKAAFITVVGAERRLEAAL